MWINLCSIWVDPIHKRFTGNIDSHCLEKDTVIYILAKNILKDIHASATRKDAH